MSIAPMNRGVLLSSFLGHKGRAAHAEQTRYGPKWPSCRSLRRQNDAPVHGDDYRGDYCVIELFVFFIC